MSAEDVARWMFHELMQQGELWHVEAVAHNKAAFGEEFIRQNENGSEVIDRRVLALFKEMYDGKAKWESSQKFWRRLEPGERA
jgi:hypothetical protein